MRHRCRARVGHRLGCVEQRRGDLGAEPRAGRAEALDPERALVQTVEPMLPGEADAAEHLDRGLADARRRSRRRTTSRPRRDRRLRVARRDAPRRPERERARELDARVRVGERVRDGLVDADLLAELLARRRVLERVLEREPRDAARLERERRLRARLDLGEAPGVREPPAGLATAYDAERTRLVRRRRGPRALPPSSS